MATHTTDLAGKQESVINGDKLPIASSLEYGARTLTSTAVYTIKGTEIANDTIALAYLPRGARILPEQSHIISEGVGTLSLSIGTEDDLAAYSAAAAVGPSGTYQFAKGTRAVIPDAFDCQTPVIAKIMAITTPTAGKKILVRIAYAFQ